MTVACDCESTGLNSWKGDRAFAWSFCWGPGKTEYTRGTVDPFTRVVSWTKPHLARLKEILESPEPKVFHNSKFDIRMADAMGIKVGGRIDDTYVAMHCLRSHELLGLKPVCKRYLGISDGDQKDLQKAVIKARHIGKLRGWSLAEDVEADYWMAPAALVKAYAVQDVERTLELFSNINPLLDEEEVRRVYEMEMRLLPITYGMETRGMAVNNSVIESEILRYSHVLEAEQKALAKAAWPGFNPNAPEQVKELMFDRLKLVPKHFTEKGSPSVDKDTLKEYDHGVVVHLLNYKAADAAINKFLRQYQRLEVAGVLHPDFRQLGPRTGRYSCSMPNLQNVASGREGDPRVITIDARKPFGPRPGWVWYAFDFSQIEARILAELAGEETLLEAFRSKEDVHLKMANRVWGDPSKRTIAKQVVYTVVYGGGAKTLNKKYRIPIPEARRIIKEFHAQAPAIKTYSSRLEAEGMEYGFIRTVLGRKVWADPGRLYGLLDYRIQGSAADLMKLAILRVDYLLPSLTTEAYLISTVHDEIILETKGNLSVGDVEVVKKVMENTEGLLTVPIEVDVSVIRESWSKKEKWNAGPKAGN